MAPNKKKKKPASNPTRGFATTSTASKAKNEAPTELENGLQSVTLGAHNVSEDAENGIQAENPSNKEPEKALYELTPEELESQLENASLQILVENHGDRMKKSVSRQVSKLQTEKRLLRSQAEHLGIRQWLPPEIMQIITDQLREHKISSGYLKANSDSNKAVPDLSEDDLLIKLWTLKCSLPLLGFSEQRTDLSLRHLLTTLNKVEPKNFPSSKDTIWGLDESLTWLAFDSEPTDLPKFDGREGQSHQSAEQQRPEMATNTPATTPTNSRPESPLSKGCRPQQPQTSGEDSSLSSASDSDSDAEPEHSVTKYLQLLSRLHELNPELTDIGARRQRRAKGKQPVINGSVKSAGNRRIEHLSAKIDKIKSDLLFDEDKANSRWAEIRIDLVQEAAERKRLGIKNDGEQQRVTPTARRSDNLAEPIDDDEDTNSMLGGFFSSLPDTATDPATGLSIMSATTQEGGIVEIRDFGKWTGMSPRRVLEEACKAR